MDMTAAKKKELLGKIDRLLEAEPCLYEELYFYVMRLSKSVNWEHHCMVVSRGADEFGEFLNREP